MGVDDKLISPVSPSSPSGNQSSPEKSIDSNKPPSDASDEDESPHLHHQASSPNEIQHSLEEFEKNLPSTVEVLTAPNGAKVYLVGTAHFSIESQNDVSAVINAVKPHVVMVELCQNRASILQMDEETIEREAKNISFEKMRVMMKDHGAFQGLMYILLLNMTAQLTKDLGMAPGGEFRRALAEAKKLQKCVIQFGDRPISITLKRALSVLSWWQSIRLIWLLLFTKQTISKEEVEKCKQRDLLDSMLAEMAGQFPVLNRVFVSERDVYLTYSLQLAAHTHPGHLFSNVSTESIPNYVADEPPRVVGIVGIGHAAGIANHWMKVTDDMIPPLMSIPPRSRSSKVIAVSFKLAVVGLLGYGCYRLLPGSKALSKVIQSVSIPELPFISKSIGGLKTH